MQAYKEGKARKCVETAIMHVHIFKELIKAQYPVLYNTDVPMKHKVASLTHKEQNAVRYVAGYVTCML